MFLEEGVILHAQIARKSITRWAQLILPYDVFMHGVKDGLFNLQKNIREALLGIYGAHVHIKSRR
jgi:hypothetical protein